VLTTIHKFYSKEKGGGHLQGKYETPVETLSISMHGPKFRIGTTKVEYS